MSPERSDRNGTAPLDALLAALATARQIAEEMNEDPLFNRLAAAYAQAPLEDRRVLVNVFAREVGLRLTTLSGGSQITGIDVRPNPNARLYLRSFEKLEDRTTPLTHDELVFSSVRSVRIMRLVLEPDVHEPWRAATLEAFCMLDADDRKAVRTVLGKMLDILDHADARSSESGSPVG